MRPHDPFHFHHHLIRRKEAHYSGERVPEEHSFYEEVAKDLNPAQRNRSHRPRHRKKQPRRLLKRILADPSSRRFSADYRYRKNGSLGTDRAPNRGCGEATQDRCRLTACTVSWSNYGPRICANGYFLRFWEPPASRILNQLLVDQVLSLGRLSIRTHRQICPQDSSARKLSEKEEPLDWFFFTLDAGALPAAF